ncbi:hypothetical protein ABPG72_021378 [Tetrahymena utriculariae]
MNFLVLILLHIKFLTGTWLISQQNLLPGFSGTDGWSISGSYCGSNRSDCAGRIILGGYGCFGVGATATQTFLIAHHWQVNVQIKFWMLDSWDYESLVVDLGDLHISQLRQLSSGYQICGAFWNDEIRDVSVTKQNHYERNIQVVFSSNLDQDPTDESWGITDFTISVEPCNPTCNRCQGQDAFLCMDCWPNAQFITYQNGLGFCQCNDGFYNVSKNVPCLDPICSQCFPCDNTCESCSAGDQYSCISCKPTLYKQYYGVYEVNNNLSDPRYQKTLCQSNCFAQNYYKDTISRSCLKCFSTCQTCNSQLEYDCTSCINGLYLDGATTGQCVSTCSPSYYKDDSDKKCKKCDSNCLECLDNQPQFCSKCVNGSFLTISTGKCVTDCGIGQWGRSTDWSCQLCDSTCYTCEQNARNCISCSGINYLYNNQCKTTCIDGYYKGTNNTCQKCDQSCNTCDNGSNTDCLSCSPSFGYLKDRQCISCPPQFYGDSSDQTCKPCNSSCYTCDGGNNTDCLSCTTNYLQDRQCKAICNSGYWGNSATHTCDKCDINCLTCSLYGPAIDCQSCSSPLFLKDKRCVQSCNPIGEYGDDDTRKCTNCDATCYTCTQKTDSDCASCTGSRYFYNNKCLTTCPAPSQYGLNNKCTSACPSNMYGDDSSRLCTLCDPICPTCFGSLTSLCYSCAAPYYLEGSTCGLNCPSNKYNNDNKRECSPCHAECLECNGGTNSDCTKCDPVKYFGSNKCFSSCPTPYFSSTTTMECVLKCPKGYWGDANDPQRLCQLCHPQCEECFSGTFAQCTKCKQNFYLFQTTCDSCPINYFPNTQTRTCDQCFTTCKSCDGPSSSNCLSCNLDRYYLADKKECYDICPSPYFSHFTKPDCLLTCPTDFQNYLFGNPVTRKCEGCNEACQQCTGSTNLDCVKCAAKYFYYQQNNSCLLTCPDNTYADSISMKCLPCDKSCATCNGGSNSNCTSCLLPSVLYFSQCIQNCPNPLYKDEDLKQCVTDCTSKYPNKYADTINMVCNYCHKYCNKCTGPSNTQCQKCKSSYFKYNNSCIEQCQSGTYQVDKKLSESEDDCKKCSSDCETCYGPSNQNCLTCNSSLYSLKKNDILSCLSDCPDKYVKNIQIKSCQECPSLTYYFQGQCKQCHYTCDACLGSFENQCLTCVETRGQNSQKTPYKGVCSCQQGYIETFQKQCEKTPTQVQGLTVSIYVSSITGTVGSFLIGVIGRNMFFLYNILEIAQFTSYFRFINFNYPVNLGDIFDNIYISQISTVFNLNSQAPSSADESLKNKQNANSRILENTAFDDNSYLFELKGKVFPLWKSFFFLIILNIFSWVFVFGLNLLASHWKIKYNQSYFLEKLRTWTSYGLPIQMFLRTQMEAILYLVLVLKYPSESGVLDWIFSIKSINLDDSGEPVIYFQKIVKSKVANGQILKQESSQAYPHPFRTLWQFTKKDKISRNYFLFNLVFKLVLVVLVVELVQSSDKQILSFAIIKTMSFLLVVSIRPMISFWYNLVVIFNEFFQAICCYLIYICIKIQPNSQNSLGYSILVVLFLLFLVNLLGTLISLIFMLKMLIDYLVKKKSVATNTTQVQIKKQARIEALNKSQKLDLFDYQVKIKAKNEPSRIIDNSSTLQIQRDNNQDDFDLSKVQQNQNDSVYQYDVDNPFQFLEIQQSQILQIRKHKKTKKFADSLEKKYNKEDDYYQNQSKIKDNHQKQNQEGKSIEQQDDIIDITKQIREMNEKEKKQFNLNNKVQDFTDDFQMISNYQPNQQDLRQDQDIRSQSDYIYNKIPHSETPATQFIANTPSPLLYSSKMCKEESKLFITPTPNSFAISNNCSPQIQNEQLANLEINREEKDDKQYQKQMKVNPNIQKNSQLQIKFNQIQQQQDFNEQELEANDKIQQHQPNLNIISFLSEITGTKYKNKKSNKKKVIKF